MRKLILASLTISAAISLQAQSRSGGGGSLQQRVTRLIDQPPFDRATWNIYVQDDRGRVLFNRNGDRFSVPASNTKLIVAVGATRHGRSAATRSTRSRRAVATRHGPPWMQSPNRCGHEGYGG